MSPVQEKPFPIIRPDGLTLHALAWPGTGDRVLLGHSHVVHAGQLRSLARAFAARGHAVLCPDLRGHGHSVNAANPPMHLDGPRGWQTTVADLLATCDLWFDGVPHDRRTIVVPNIMALATLDALRHRPDLAGQIVLVAPPPNQPLLARLGAAFAAARARFRNPHDPDDQFLHHIYSYLSSHLPDSRHPLDVMSPDPALIDRVLADPLCWRVPTTAYWQAIFHGLSSAWSFDRGQRVHPRTRFLILHGEADPMTRDGAYCEAMIDRLQTLAPREVTAMGIRGARSGLFLEEDRLGIAARILDWRDQGADTPTDLPRPAGTRDIEVITEHARRAGLSVAPLSPQDFVTLCYGGITDETRWVDLMMRIMLNLSQTGGEEFDRFLHEMMPHWDRAFSLHQKLLTDAAMGDVWSDMLDRLGLGCALVDARGNVLQANSRYDAALRAALGHGPGSSATRLTADLMRASDFAIPLPPQGSLLRWDGLPVGLMVQTPALARHVRRLGGPVGIVVLRPTTDDAAPDLAALAEAAWGLTPQEARVALGVMQGQTPQDIAATLGLSINTVRSHLAQAYAKTGSAGKAELAATLNRSPLGWLSGTGDAS